MRMPTKLVVATLLAAPFLATGATLAAAQALDANSRWAPWVGCWRLVTDRDREAALDVADALAGAPLWPARRVDPVLVCISPGEQPAAAVQATVVNEQRILETIVVADGADRPLVEEGCRGSQRAEWSRTGRQLFSFAHLACEGQAPRRISSLSALLAGPTWLDVQMIDVDGRRSVRVRRYERAEKDVPAAGARSERGLDLDRQLPQSFTVADVKEASGKVAPAVLEAALVETASRFPLNRRRLIELSDAGVSEGVIDLMVALTYPKKLEVARAPGGGPGPAGGFYSPWEWDDAVSMLSLYAPFSYRYWGYYNPGYNPGWGWVPVDPGGPVGPEAKVVARAIDGHGYTRVQPRQPAPSDGWPRGTGGSDSSSGASASGSSGTVSPSGYSSGGDTGRTAQPRPPGPP